MTSSTRKPLLVVADDDRAARGHVEAELSRRYGADYAVRGCNTAEMEEVLLGAREQGDDAAIVLAAGATGAELLAGVRQLHPAARRGLLIPWLGWMDRSIAQVVLRAMARGWIDLYVLRPTREGDEVFHRTIASSCRSRRACRARGLRGQPSSRIRARCGHMSSAPRSRDSGFRIACASRTEARMERRPRSPLRTEPCSGTRLWRS